VIAPKHDPVSATLTGWGNPADWRRWPTFSTSSTSRSFYRPKRQAARLRRRVRPHPPPYRSRVCHRRRYGDHRCAQL